MTCDCEDPCMWLQLPVVAIVRRRDVPAFPAGARALVHRAVGHAAGLDEVGPRDARLQHDSLIFHRPAAEPDVPRLAGRARAALRRLRLCERRRRRELPRGAPALDPAPGPRGPLGCRPANTLLARMFCARACGGRRGRRVAALAPRGSFLRGLGTPPWAPLSRAREKAPLAPSRRPTGQVSEPSLGITLIAAAEP